MVDSSIKSNLDSLNGLTRLAKIVLAYTVIVIMWGAFVRATGSGAGCGEHWPLCNGEIIPRAPSMSRIIEFSHRLSSGMSLVLVVALVLKVRKAFGKGHAIRSAAYWSLAFIIGEALVGAMLVVLQLVAKNDSVLRAIVIAFHLVNTFLLLFWLSKVVFLVKKANSNFPLAEAQLEANVKQVVGVASRAKFNIMLCMIAFVITGAAGAIVALGDTLFPAASLAEGMAQDFSPTAHFLIKLRIWHPVFAVFSTIYIFMQTLILPRIFRGIVHSKIAMYLMGLILCQLLGGFLNWYLLAPVWMQLVHLMLADATWIVLCFWYFNVLQHKIVDRIEGVTA